MARRGALRTPQDLRVDDHRAVREGVAPGPPGRHLLQVRLVLHRRLGGRGHGPLLLHPLQPGRRLHQERQGEGGGHEHAVSYAR